MGKNKRLKKDTPERQFWAKNLQINEKTPPERAQDRGERTTVFAVPPTLGAQGRPRSIQGSLK